MKTSRNTLTRRELVRWIAAGTLASAVPSRAEEPVRTMATRAVPGSREAIPVIGMGSSNTFDVGASDAERAPLGEVLRALTDAGGSVIDTSPMYGRAEQTIGDLVESLGLRSRLWFATKVSTTRAAWRLAGTRDWVMRVSSGGGRYSNRPTRQAVRS